MLIFKLINFHNKRKLVYYILSLGTKRIFDLEDRNSIFFFHVTMEGIMGNVQLFCVTFWFFLFSLSLYICKHLNLYIMTKHTILQLPCIYGHIIN